MRPDIDQHLPLLDELEMSIQDKREMLETLLLFIENHIDRAFGRHPVQHVCGQDTESVFHTCVRGIESEGKLRKSEFNKVSGKGAES